jgi:redox-sensing transcriptional repressor
MMSSRKMMGLPTVRRLARYHHEMCRLKLAGRETVSSTELAERLELEPVQVRKDLARTRATGKPRVGFRVDEVLPAIEEYLGWDTASGAVLVGVGSLGEALLGYEGFSDYGLNIAAAFDADENKIGTEIRGYEVLPMEELGETVEHLNLQVGIIAVPDTAAQEVVDRLVEAGIRGIWNFAPMTPRVPEGVVLQNEDLAAGLAVLSVQLSKARGSDPSGSGITDNEQ